MKKNIYAVLGAAFILSVSGAQALESAAVTTSAIVPATTAGKSGKGITAQDVINKLGLTPIPDNCGGDFKEIYRSTCSAQTADPRSCGTIIYHLIKADYVVPLHKMASDETFTYLAGEPQLLVLVHPDGSMEEVTLGNNLLKGEIPLKTVPAGTWMGERIKKPSKHAWSLVSITVIPGFDINDFTDGNPQALAEQFPATGKRLKELGLFIRAANAK